MSNVVLLNKYKFTHFEEPSWLTNGNDKQKTVGRQLAIKHNVMQYIIANLFAKVIRTK